MVVLDEGHVVGTKFRPQSQHEGHLRLAPRTRRREGSCTVSVATVALARSAAGLLPSAPPPSQRGGTPRHWRGYSFPGSPAVGLGRPAAVRLSSRRGPSGGRRGRGGCPRRRGTRTGSEAGQRAPPRCTRGRVRVRRPGAARQEGNVPPQTTEPAKLERQVPEQDVGVCAGDPMLGPFKCGGLRERAYGELGRRVAADESVNGLKTKGANRPTYVGHRTRTSGSSIAASALSPTSGRTVRNAPIT